MASVRPPMRRDSLFGERIVWRGRPARLALPGAARWLVLAAAIAAATSAAFAAVVGRGLGRPPAGLLVFSATCASIALFGWRLPRIRLAATEYLVTDAHVIARWGPFRRSIERAAISYAIVRWDAAGAGTGDLELVRAVPTGALRRTLRLDLAGVPAPDRLWAVVRGVEPGAPLGDGSRPLAQRLDADERILWSGAPRGAPWSGRRVGEALVAAGTLVAALVSARGATRAVLRVLDQHALGTFAAVALVTGVALGVTFAFGVAAVLGYRALVAPARLASRTRYYVTDRRVLIQRGDEELHLDRANIADAIPLAGAATQGTLFLVLDGPRARGFSSSGAFGRDEGAGLSPVLWSLDDVETPRRLLAAPPAPAPGLRDAA